MTLQVTLNGASVTSYTPGTTYTLTVTTTAVNQFKGWIGERRVIKSILTLIIKTRLTAITFHKWGPMLHLALQELGVLYVPVGRIPIPVMRAVLMLPGKSFIYVIE